MEKLKVNLTREEVSSYFKQVMKITTPDTCWNFTASFSEKQLEDMQEECEAKLDTREWKDAKACYPFIESNIWHKMKVFPSKTGKFDPESLKLQPDAIEAFRNQICELIGLSTYKPVQQQLEMPETEE